MGAAESHSGPRAGRLPGWVPAWVQQLGEVLWRLIAPQFVPFVGGAILSNHNFFVGAGAVLVTLGGFITYKGYAPSAPEIKP